MATVSNEPHSSQLIIRGFLKNTFKISQELRCCPCHSLFKGHKVIVNNDVLKKIVSHLFMNQIYITK